MDRRLETWLLLGSSGSHIPKILLNHRRRGDRSDLSSQGAARNTAQNQLRFPELFSLPTFFYNSLVRSFANEGTP